MPNHAECGNRSRVFVVFIMLVAAFALVAASSLVWTSDAAYAAPKKGWNSSHTKYYVKGKAVRGAKKIGKKYYAFNASGKLAKTGKAFSIGSKTYYPTKKGILRGMKKGKTYYYANGKKMIKADAMDFACLLRAEEIVKEVTKPTDSRAVKLEKTFRWVMETEYLSGVIPYEKKLPGWIATYARQVFDERKGDCISDAAAFSYLAAAIGCKNVQLCTTASTTNPHAWTAIGDRYYDPRFARKSFNEYYNVGQGTYFFTNKYRFSVPYYSMANAPAKKATSKSKKAKKKTGWVTDNGLRYYYKNGKKLKKKWLKLKGKRYYLKTDGRMATGSFKVGGHFYLARPNGTVMTGKKTRVVSALGSKYRLDKNGRAVPGWTNDLKRCYLKTGEMAKYAQIVSGSPFYFDSKGNLDFAKTVRLRDVLRADATVDGLKVLLGEPYRIKKYGESCYTVNDMGGIDRRYDYPRLKVYTLLCKDGREYIVSWK